MTQYFSKPFCGDINVKVHLSNYAKKIYISHVDTSSLH